MLVKGEIDDVRVNHRASVDKIVGFGLAEGFLKEGMRCFPDPRKQWEVPIEALLLPQILQRLNDEHSLLLAPYMLNDADLISSLGFNVRCLEEGFNKRNKTVRLAPFHGETLKQLLLGARVPKLIEWFNNGWLPLWRANSPGRTKQYLLDGMKIEVPAHLGAKYQGAGMVKNPDDSVSWGYKAVWLQEVIDNKGVIVALTIVPIQVHELNAAKEMVETFPFEVGARLIMDRGFISGEWITHLKQERKVEVFVPLRRNMDATQTAVSTADNRETWNDHPTRKGQKVADVSLEEGTLHWKECPVIESGALVRWVMPDGTPQEVLFVTTEKNCTSKKILEIYDQRAEIEESHRQMKQNQGIENLPSKKFVHVVFRILMNVISFNLMTLFLNSENCDTFEQYSLRAMRQRRSSERNPKVIIYAGDSFATLRLLEFVPMILEYDDKVRKKLAKLLKNLGKAPAPG